MSSRINHVGLSVSDIDASIAFYRDVIGMTVVFESVVTDNPGLAEVVGYPDVRARMAFLDFGETRLEMWCYALPRGRSEAGGRGPADHGFSHVAFEVPDVDAAHAAVLASGHAAVSAPKDLGIHKTCYVRGPDGEIIELLEDRGSSAQRLAEIMSERRAAAAAHSDGA